MAKKYDTPLLDELKTGPFPSFVTEIEKATETADYAKDLLGVLELSFKEKQTHWKHGGIVGVRGYGGGVIGRYSDVPDQFPGVAHFHTVRVNQPSGFFYKTDSLREICDIWDKYGSGLTNMHGSTGDLVLLGTNTESLEPIFAELSIIEPAPMDVPGPTSTPSSITTNAPTVTPLPSLTVSAITAVGCISPLSCACASMLSALIASTKLY